MSDHDIDELLAAARADQERLAEAAQDLNAAEAQRLAEFLRWEADEAERIIAELNRQPKEDQG